VVINIGKRKKIETILDDVNTEPELRLFFMKLFENKKLCMEFCRYSSKDYSVVSRRFFLTKHQIQTL
jgi:hypothetical protein